MEEIIPALAAARIGDTFNQYAQGPRAPLLRRRLAAYLASRADAPLVLVGEAAGYRGARVSGIPFTSERQLAGTGPAEATATIVHRVLRELGLEEEALLWNVVPTHPGTPFSNRRPTREEVAASLPFLRAVVRGRRAVAVGRLAEAVLGAPYVRHPSRGGAQAFRSRLALLLGPQARLGSQARRSACQERQRHAIDELLPSSAGEGQTPPLGEEEAAHPPVARPREAELPRRRDQAPRRLGMRDVAAGQAA